MGSSYKSIDLFGSGAHEFVVGRFGRRIISLSSIAGDSSVDGSAEFGDLELRVQVRGRLVASSDSALWTLRDAIASHADSSESSGILEDQHGHQWTTMKLLTVEEFGAVSHGRKVSIGYVVEFGQLSSG